MRNRIFRSIVIAALTSTLIFPIGARWSDLPVAASDMEQPVFEEIVSESDLEIPEAEPGEDALVAEDEMEQAGGDMEQAESSVAEEESQQEEPTEQPIPEEIISAIAESVTSDSSQPQDQPSAQNVLTFTFEKDIVLPSTQTVENYSEETLKTVTLLDGVIVKDEKGQDVQPWVSDLGGFTASDLASVGKTFSITYSAKHPVSGEVQTAVHDMAVGGPTARITTGPVVYIDTSDPNAELMFREALSSINPVTNKIYENITINLTGKALQLQNFLFFRLDDENSPSARTITLQGEFDYSTSQYTSIGPADGLERFPDGNRIIEISGNGSLTLNMENVQLDGKFKVGGVRVGQGASLTMNAGKIVNSAAITPEDRSGNALRVDDGAGNITLINCQFDNDLDKTEVIPTDFGGVVAVMGRANVRMTSISLWGGTAQNGGGLYVGPGGNVTINEDPENASQHGSIYGNTASENGGGIFVADGATLRMDYTVISSNVAANYGGGLFTEAGANPVRAESVTFESNIAKYGGGIFITDSDITVIGTDFGGGYFLQNRAEVNGGGVYVKQPGTFTMRGYGSFIANSAQGTNPSDGGGAIYTEDEAYQNISTDPVIYFMMNQAHSSRNPQQEEFAHLGNIGYHETSLGADSHPINILDINYFPGSGQMLKLLKVPTLVDYGSLTIAEAVENKWRQPDTVEYSDYNSIEAYQDYAIVVQSTMANWNLRVDINELVSDEGGNLGNALTYRRDNSSTTNGVILNEINPGNVIDSNEKTYGVLKWDPLNDEGLLLNTSISPLATGQFTNTITWTLSVEP